MRILVRMNKMFNFKNYSTKSIIIMIIIILLLLLLLVNYYDNSNKLVVGKMKNETAGVMIKEFVGLKPKMYFFWVDDRSEHKKSKGVSKKVVKTISHNEYKDVLLNNKYLILNK